MATASQVLRKAREGWKKEQWTKKATALRCDGKILHQGNAPGAVRWCARGRIEFASGLPTDGNNPAVGPLRFLDKAIAGDGARTVTAWNDAPTRTFQEVLAAFDRAIALAEQEEATGGAQ